MIDWLAGRIERVFSLPFAQTRRAIHLLGVALAASVFVLIATMLVAFDSVFLGANNIAALQVGDIAPQDIRAPLALPPYVSQVLTEQRRQEVRAGIGEVYFPPDPAVSRQQTDLAHQILRFIENVRADSYGTLDQKTRDLQSIADLRLDESIITLLLTLDDASWKDISDQVTGILERVMRGEIRESNLPSIQAQLPTQVSVRSTEEQAAVIVAIVRALVRPNTLLNQQATETARDEAANRVEVRRSFERGQIVVRAGEQIDAAAYEALGQLGLLEPTDQRLQKVIRALLASITVMVVTGLYIGRFQPTLFGSARFMILLAAIFLITLAGARLTAISGQIYLYPTAALALLYVALATPQVAVIGVLALATLIGIMQNNSLEMALLVGVGGFMATLSLRRPERLNGYFMPGLLVALANTAVVTLFYQDGTLGSDAINLGELLLYCLLNGTLSATAALGGMYAVTLLFNLPTGLKLVELSQPSHPLLQRLLREAPGTYQHSLQVGNLAEQAAIAIGASADLVRVGALYHDIGKMLNAPFFTENQVEGVNPHDTLNDPARSADIIISHVTDGDKLARQYRLPNRIRDFILEHHGTQVLYFYQQAVERAAPGQEIDQESFTYPGPRPQSRETALLMLADSCEAAVRSRKPTRKQEIADTVQNIIDIKIRTGQLDDSGLTLSDIKTVRKTFVDMLQAVYHPRISYPAAASRPAEAGLRPAPAEDVTTGAADGARRTADMPATRPEKPRSPKHYTGEILALKLPDDDDETPLPEVPPLPRPAESRSASSDNGLSAADESPAPDPNRDEVG